MMAALSISNRTVALVAICLFLCFSISTGAEKNSDSRSADDKHNVNYADDRTDSNSPDSQYNSPNDDSLAAPAMLPEPSVNWSVMSSAGGQTSVPGFIISGTLGQTVAGASSVGDLGLNHGFWQDFQWYDPSCCGQYTGGFTGNTDCDTEGKRNIGDIVLLVDNVYVTKTPLCCPPEGNVDGDTIGKINLGDIVTLVDHIYVSKAETAPCE